MLDNALSFMMSLHLNFSMMSSMKLMDSCAKIGPSPSTLPGLPPPSSPGVEGLLGNCPSPSSPAGRGTRRSFPVSSKALVPRNPAEREFAPR